MRDKNLHNKDCSEMHSGSCSQMTSSCRCPITEDKKCTRISEINLAFVPSCIQVRLQLRIPTCYRIILDLKKGDEEKKKTTYRSYIEGSYIEGDFNSEFQVLELHVTE